MRRIPWRVGRRWLPALWFVPLLAIALAVTIRGEDEPSAPPDAPAQPAPATDALVGAIEIDGSSTVFPITEAVAEEFQEGAPGVRVTAGVSGTGGGFERFCGGETDINDASRPIRDSEIAACAAAGIEFVELPIAFDGLTVVVNPQNDWVDFLTVDELQIIFRPQDPAVRWSEVRAHWPDREIRVYSPGADSGTFDYFSETVNGEAGAMRGQGVTFSEDDNVLVVGVEGDAGAIAYFGFSYYENNQARLQAVPITNDDGDLVLPSLETVNDGSYNPLSRPLFLYVKKSSLERPEVPAFLEFFLGEGRDLIDSPEVGYVQLPDAIYEVARARLAAGVTGSAMAGAPPGASLMEIFAPP